MLQSKKALLYFALGIVALTIPLTILVRTRIDSRHAVEHPATVAAPIPVASPVQATTSVIGSQPTVVMPGDVIEPTTTTRQGDSSVVTQTSCEGVGGRWNDCASACRNAKPGTACIQMCVAVCECASNDQCPAGTSCGKFVKGVGVCR